MASGRTILIAGTASHVGKSTVTAGLCRYLADRGVDVAPFKAQTMSNNARAVPRAAGDGFGEIGVAQYVQAQAARRPASTDHNPVLLKPRGDGESQLILNGTPIDQFSAGEYYESHWRDALAAAATAHRRLAATHDVIVAEGAGSIAEINLHHRDLANIETARFARGVDADLDIILVADIDRGGAFASLVGTLELLPSDIREDVSGAIITKFRGDTSLVTDGVAMFENQTGVPIVGVLPWTDPGLPAEDSVSFPPVGESATWGHNDGVPAARTVTIAVPQFPRASNVTDIEPFVTEPGVRIHIQPIDAALDGMDAVVLTGTKNTVDDALAAREAGLYDALLAFDGPIVGLCGGYQMLGERLTNTAIESTAEVDTIPGVGYLPVVTEFSPDKTVKPVERTLHGCGPLAGAEGVIEGYEIHMGNSQLFDQDVSRPFPDAGAAVGNVLGTYVHDIFANQLARSAFLDNVFAAAETRRPPSRPEDQSPYDRAAALVSQVDLTPLGL